MRTQGQIQRIGESDNSFTVVSRLKVNEYMEL